MAYDSQQMNDVKRTSGSSRKRTSPMRPPRRDRQPNFGGQVRSTSVVARSFERFSRR